MDTMTSTHVEEDSMMRNTVVKTSMMQDQVKTEYHSTDQCHKPAAQLSIPGFDPALFYDSQKQLCLDFYKPYHQR